MAVYLPSSKLSVDPRSGKIGRHHISDKAIQTAVKSALYKSGIPKHASVHTFRHSFATHLLQNGINIREVQSLRSQECRDDDGIYTCAQKYSNAPKSPNLIHFMKNRGIGYFLYDMHPCCDKEYSRVWTPLDK